jgi:hypothetical protein
MKIKNFASLRAFLEGDEKNFAVAQIPGGIEAQEKMAQEDLVLGQKLPKQGIVDHRKELEALGFQFGKDVDDLLISCSFPQGWTIKPTDHPLWSTVYDEQGAERISVFYKGAFYDRCAFASIVKGGK